MKAFILFALITVVLFIATLILSAFSISTRETGIATCIFFLFTIVLFLGRNHRE